MEGEGGGRATGYINFLVLRHSVKVLPERVCQEKSKTKNDGEARLGFHPCLDRKPPGHCPNLMYHVGEEAAGFNVHRNENTRDQYTFRKALGKVKVGKKYNRLFQGEAKGRGQPRQQQV